MNTIKDLWAALRRAVYFFRLTFAERRHLRRGGNPDNLPF